MGCCSIGGKIEFPRRPTAGAAGSCANIGAGDAAAIALVVECTIVWTGAVGAAGRSEPLRNNALGADRNTVDRYKCGTLRRELSTGLGHGRQTCNQLRVSTLSNRHRSELEVGPWNSQLERGGGGRVALLRIVWGWSRHTRRQAGSGWQGSSSREGHVGSLPQASRKEVRSTSFPEGGMSPSQTRAARAAADETALRLWFSVSSFECSVVAAAVRGVAGGAAGDVCGTVVVPSEGG